MSFLKQVEAGGGAVDDLIRALYQTVGNKRFMSDVEKLFHEKLTDLSAHDEETLRYLMRALRQL